MKIEILEQAQDDLIHGFRFYEGREAGLGVYFLDCLLSDIDSLLVFAGIHQVYTAITGASPSAFQLRFTTAWRGSDSRV